MEMKKLNIKLFVYDEDYRPIDDIYVPVFDSGIYWGGFVKDNKVTYDPSWGTNFWDIISNETTIYPCFKSEFIPIVFYESLPLKNFYLVVASRSGLARVNAFQTNETIEQFFSSKTTYIQP